MRLVFSCLYGIKTQNVCGGGDVKGRKLGCRDSNSCVGAREGGMQLLISTSAVARKASNKCALYDTNDHKMPVRFPVWLGAEVGSDVWGPM